MILQKNKNQPQINFAHVVWDRISRLVLYCEKARNDIGSVVGKRPCVISYNKIFWAVGDVRPYECVVEKRRYGVPSPPVFSG